MIAINTLIIERIYSEDKINIDLIISGTKKNLFSVLNKRPPFRIQFQGQELDNNQINYLHYLHSNFDKITRSNRENLVKFKTAFDNIISVKQMRSNSHKIFRNELLYILGYKKLRNSFLPEYFEKVGIKVCVYCNSQLAITVRKVDGIRSAKFQVDHYFSKSDYPCFSISFYNLYPVCGSCNISKSTNDVIFDLYSDKFEDYKTSRFKFELDKKSLVKYRVNGNNAELKIKFIDTKNSNFNATFAIEGIYETQKDVAEELVLKSMMYNKAYIETLKNSLKRLYKDKTPLVEQLILGNYINDIDIHKRPLSKFTQDIAKQLKLI